MTEYIELQGAVFLLENVVGLHYPGSNAIIVALREGKFTVRQKGVCEHYISYASEEAAKDAFKAAREKWKAYQEAHNPDDNSKDESLSEAIYTALKKLGWDVTQYGVAFELGKALDSYNDRQIFGNRIYDAIKEGCAEGVKAKK